MPAPDRRDFSYSIVVPVYNSERIVGRTVDAIVSTFSDAGLRFQVVLVNDGSTDGSWAVIRDKARADDRIVALNLLRNYGQHFANVAGFAEATGDFVVTMDDDLQNPPDQALLLIDEAITGRDVVFGKFEAKRASFTRRLGSKAIGALNRRIFGQPPELTVSNFRVLRREVVERICASRTAHPYITGQALLFSSNRANVTVRHEPRAEGKSTYSLRKIFTLVFTIMFSYSSFPLRASAVAGFVVAVLSLVLGAIYFIKGLVSEAAVPGWTTIVVLLAFFNGVTIALLSMLGEYVVRTLNTVSSEEIYHVRERVSGCATSS